MQNWGPKPAVSGGMSRTESREPSVSVQEISTCNCPKFNNKDLTKGPSIYYHCVPAILHKISDKILLSDKNPLI